MRPCAHTPTPTVDHRNTDIRPLQRDAITPPATVQMATRSDLPTLAGDLNAANSMPPAPTPTRRIAPVIDANSTLSADDDDDELVAAVFPTCVLGDSSVSERRRQ